MEQRLKAILAKSGKKVIGGLQWPFVSFLKFLLWLGDKKRAFPSMFGKVLKWGVAPIVTLAITWFGFKADDPSQFWIEHCQWLESHNIKYAVVWSFVASSLTYTGVIVMSKVLLPLLIYAPHAVSMRSMGLVEARIQHEGMQKTLNKYLQFHDKSKPVKVICISGFSLFTRVGKDGDTAPLYKYAREGNLHVLMPRSDPTNPTIKERYDTYSLGYRKSHYQKIGRLIDEIDASKDFLRENTGNILKEHNALCMWRVVLLSGHCFVQNYFPNHSGCQSDFSPVFVFEKEDDCPHSYYETFSKMFEIMTK